MWYVWYVGYIMMIVSRGRKRIIDANLSLLPKLVDANMKWVSPVAVVAGVGESCSCGCWGG